MDKIKELLKNQKKFVIINKCKSRLLFQFEAKIKSQQ